MHSEHINIDRKAGSALIVSFGVLFLFAMTAFAMLSLSEVNRTVSRDEVREVRAEILAKSGIEKAHGKLTEILKEKQSIPGTTAMYGRPAKGPHNSVIQQQDIPLEKAYWVSFSGGAGMDGVDSNEDGEVDDPLEKEEDTDANRNHSIRITGFQENGTGADDVNNDLDDTTDELDEGGKAADDSKQYVDRVGYSGETPSTVEEGRDLYSVKVRGTQGMIYINGPEEDPFDSNYESLAKNKKKMLNRLGTILNNQHQGEDEWKRIPANIGELISRARIQLDGDLDNIRDLKHIFRTRFDQEGIISQLKPYITTRAWVDQTTIDPGSIVNRKSTGDDPTEGNPGKVRATSDGKDQLQPRAPINVNTAPKEVLMTVFSGIRATYLDRYSNAAIDKTSTNKPTESPGKGPNKESNVVEVSMDLAEDIAKKIKQRRSELMSQQGKGFTGYNQLHNFIYALDEQDQLDVITSNSDVSSLSDPGDWGVADKQERLALQQAIVANINPNTKLDSVNPNFSMGVRYGDVTKSNLGGPILNRQGSDNIGWTTELNFFSTHYRITSIGRVLGPPTENRQSTSAVADDWIPARNLKAQEKLEAVIKLRESYRLSTQKEFLKNSVTSRSSRFYRSLHPENLRDRKDNGNRKPAAYDGYLTLPTKIPSSGRPVQYNSDLSPDPNTSGSAPDAGSSVVDSFDPSELLADGYFASDENCPENLIHQNGGYLMSYLNPQLEYSAVNADPDEDGEWYDRWGQNAQIVAGFTAAVAAAILGAGPLMVIGIGIFVWSLLGCDCCPDEGDVESDLMDEFGGDQFFGAIGVWYKPTWFEDEFPQDNAKETIKSGSKTIFDVGGLKEKDPKTSTNRIDSWTRVTKKKYNYSIYRFQMGIYNRSEQLKLTGIRSQKDHQFIRKITETADNAAMYGIYPLFGWFGRRIWMYSLLNNSFGWSQQNVSKEHNYDETIEDSTKEVPADDDPAPARDPYFVNPSEHLSDVSSSRENARSWDYPGRWHYPMIQVRRTIQDFDVSLDEECDSGDCDCSVEDVDVKTSESFRLVVDGEPSGWETELSEQKVWEMHDGWPFHTAHSKAGLIALEDTSDNKDNSVAIVGSPYYGDPSLSYKNNEGKPYSADATIGGIDIFNVKAENTTPPDRYVSDYTYESLVGPRMRNKHFRTRAVSVKGELASINWTGYTPKRSSVDTDIEVSLTNRSKWKTGTVQRGESIQDVSNLTSSGSSSGVEPSVRPGDRLELKVKLSAEGNWKVETPILDSITVHVVRHDSEYVRYSVSE